MLAFTTVLLYPDGCGTGEQPTYVCCPNEWILISHEKGSGTALISSQALREPHRSHRVSSCKNIHMSFGPWQLPCHWPSNCTQRRSSTPQGSQYLLLESGAPMGFMEPTQASPDGREHLTQLEARQMCVSALSAKPGAWASYFTLPSVCKLKGKMHVGIHQIQRGDWLGGFR